ncbi:MAG: hypothetical protein A3G39_09755 [Deltaproteobacteria bacterium RIFCSPLOWO2_12_FULL_43_16]|nr:MAG: hypothetical protein A2Z89_06155 [Deltaproteobacteria bacterium GWA2_43_19]OGQ11015.1 MAG: hypothetical protein A3D30_01865 [Deltaproteobacteria bacterium RIFCSPHIGHO2_02_FULL_43_33]OGQ44125.1 MAG: hypothetical protein A3A85_05930 [Deltaproteobacteria bacterium RIFCSPLOWO2_01_FULL_42_9]OGQ60130.1 MAG: hypothetical protein A3G39_09755 [Deltaproteobacteria bacterium RIFCSPLOWO2_12_FULL_43_16]HBR16188.1 response regulator [Deltaproteobacteria bacterium]
MTSKTTKKKPISEDAIKVLIAEDNAVSRKSLSSQLESLGFNVVAAAATGEEVCSLFPELKPDLIIMDIKMPKMDGIEAAKVITKHASIPIILVTGHSSETVISRAMESGVGVFAYLLKPITKKDLLPAIKVAFARHNEFQTLKSEFSDLKDALETRKLVERAKGILMKRLTIPEDEAFKLLQTQSQKENKKLKEIAETVITASRML